MHGHIFIKVESFSSAFRKMNGKGKNGTGMMGPLLWELSNTLAAPKLRFCCEEATPLSVPEMTQTKEEKQEIVEFRKCVIFGFM